MDILVFPTLPKINVRYCCGIVKHTCSLTASNQRYAITYIAERQTNQVFSLLDPPYKEQNVDMKSGAKVAYA